MKVITYPTREIEYQYNTKIFIAGGISNCPDWQSYVIEKLTPVTTYATLLNPRREAFDISIESESAKQIEWEHYMLDQADWVLFWFPKETLCPITLLELGKMMMTKKRLFVGCEPEYARRFDVIHQLKLERPEVKVVDDLDVLVDNITNAIRNY